MKTYIGTHFLSSLLPILPTFSAINFHFHVLFQPGGHPTMVLQYARCLQSVPLYIYSCAMHRDNKLVLLNFCQQHIHYHDVCNTHNLLNHYYYCRNHFTSFCLGLPRWASTRRTNHSGFCWGKRWWGGSGEPYASQTDNHLSFSRAWCSSCPPTNSIKAIKAQIYSLL